MCGDLTSCYYFIHMKDLYGYIERITYQNPENGYTVAQLQEPGRSGLTCIVGSLPGLQPGETIRCKGVWKTHLIHGSQFVIEEHRVEAPSDVIGIKKYLGSGLIKGIGPVYAERIVAKFGANTLHVIDTDPESLSDIKGIGRGRMEKIKACWQDQKTIRDVMVFLQTYGVSPAYAQKIFKKYGNHSIATVKANPYKLARDVWGIGFKMADTIAEKLGILKNAPERIDAGIEYVLQKLSDDGHVCYPVSAFLDTAQEMLEIDSELVTGRLDVLAGNEYVVIQNQVLAGALTPFVWLKSLFVAESGIASQICRLRKHPCAIRSVDTAKALEWVQEQLNIQLAVNQQEAVAAALQSKIQIITGGPGTGKSTITNAILTITSKLTSQIQLCAPTGRAAKRMSEITKRKASTIHSLLEFDFKKNGFKRDRDHPLECDLLIVDEASMIDTYLMYSLLKALPHHARIIFVGDINQLPSVGPGNVLRDIIASRCVPVITLNEIFRQAAGSRIITNAHKINNGVFPDIAHHSESDFFFIEAPEPEDVLQNILALVTQRLPKKYGLNPLFDIQVLAPMKKGLVGTENLNVALQETLNPKDNPLFRGGKKFLPGDKVMQIRNDYKRNVFNGDIGYISRIISSEQQVIVDIEDREVIYEFSDLDELVLAYAVSVHKYQGSECRCVVMPVHTTQFKLLQRNLLYTGVTRGKSLVILVGTTKAISIAVRNDEVKKRHTGLRGALIDYTTVL